MKQLPLALLAMSQALGSTAILALSCWSSRGMGWRNARPEPENTGGCLNRSWAMAPVFVARADFYVKDNFSDSLRSGGTGPQMVVIPEGLFVLGGGRSGQQDLGLVKFEYLLAISETEVTAGQHSRIG